MDTFLSSIGRPGASAVLGATGTLAVNTLTYQVETIPINNPAAPSAQAQVFPASKSNVEFGAPNKIAVIAGSTSNQTLFGNTYAPLFSTPMTGLNPNGQNFLSINWANSLSTGNNFVTFKVGFSTATAYTNVLNTSYVPGVGGSWLSGGPGTTTPVGNTLTTCVLDSDGINPDGTATLYVLGQLAAPGAAADTLYITKGAFSETTRNALVWRPI
jgi:hypothetical protein